MRLSRPREKTQRRRPLFAEPVEEDAASGAFGIKRKDEIAAVRKLRVQIVEKFVVFGVKLLKLPLHHFRRREIALGQPLSRNPRILRVLFRRCLVWIQSHCAQPFGRIVLAGRKRLPDISRSIPLSTLLVRDLVSGRRDHGQPPPLIIKGSASSPPVGRLAGIHAHHEASLRLRIRQRLNVTWASRRGVATRTGAGGRLVSCLRRNDGRGAGMTDLRREDGGVFAWGAQR